jgi:ribosomal protein L11 methyltransferase
MEAKWMEVSLVVDGELAEAVADVLGRFATNGVVVESGVKYNDAEDEGTPVGPVKVYAYLAYDEHLEETRQRLEEGLWYLGRIQPLPAPAYKPIQDEDWMSAWKEHYHPIPVGERLLVLPAWIEQTDLSRVAVKIDPSMAFGTGTHPTTQLCMELLEPTTTPGIDLIDVGCGSGILSIAALKLGAGHALAVDIDPQAVRSTRENAAANGVLENVESGVGSVSEVLGGQFSMKTSPAGAGEHFGADHHPPVRRRPGRSGGPRRAADPLGHPGAPGCRRGTSRASQRPDLRGAPPDDGLGSDFDEAKRLGHLWRLGGQGRGRI